MARGSPVGDRVVAIESTSAWTSVAIAEDGDVLGAAEHHDPRGHVEAIGVLVDRVILPVLADGVAVTRVVCGVGPGPFSGVRVGVSYARALGLGWGVPVVGVCSLDAVAASAPGAEPFVVTADARRGEVYWARYHADGRRESGPWVGAPGDIPAAARVVDRPALARDLVTYLRGADPLLLAAHPLYLRGADITVSRRPAVDVTWI